MKISTNRMAFLCAILMIAPLFSASVIQVEKEIYVIDKKESVVTWKGSMLMKPVNSHVGYAYLSKGNLTFEKGKLINGIVVVDMNTLADKDHGSDNNLIDHLKSADFFDVKKFPMASFVVNSVAPTKGEETNITGNLTIKGITQPVAFPATIKIVNGIVNVTGKVIIDRTKWDIRYKSGKFFDDLADEAISDDIVLDIKLVAKK